MSKESRRRQRTAGQASGSAPGANDRRPAAGSTGASAAASTVHPVASGSERRRSSSPTGSQRAGRRERSRPAVRQSFLQRYRRWLLGAAVVAVVAVVGAGVFASATQPAFACSNIWIPDPTASPAADASPQPGYVQPDMGNAHVAVGTVVKYTYCPPASGRHYFASGQGPIPARPYGPNDTVDPRGLGPQPRTRWARDPVQGDRCGSDGPARAVRRRAGEPGLRIPAWRQLAGPGRGPVRRHGVAVCRTRLGSRPADADARPGGGARLLRPLRRADEPGEAVQRVGESVGRPQRIRGSEAASPIRVR